MYDTKFAYVDSIQYVGPSIKVVEVEYHIRYVYAVHRINMWTNVKADNT